LRSKMVRLTSGPSMWNRSLTALPAAVWRMGAALLLGLMAFTALGNVAGWEFWPLMKLVHFPVYWALLSLGLAMWFMRERHAWMATCSGLLALLFGFQVGLLWWTSKPGISLQLPSVAQTAATPASINVMTFNVFRGNHRHGDVLAALQEARPDVLYLTEMSPEWHRALAPLSKIYPHHLGERSNLLLSVFPLEEARRVPVNFDTAQSAIRVSGDAMPVLDEGLRASWWNSEILTATVLANGNRLRIAGIHSPIPGSEVSVLMQRAIALVCRQELQADSRASARVLLGDFNTSCFSPTFRFIITQTGLRDSARGFGYTPTWGPRLPTEPWLPWIGIPIDHVLVSREIRVRERKVGPAVGSDHRWVMAMLQW
jgi:endonuclease/exonuclease/phosphatase (EEP) superfamily protein YafD